MAVQSPQTGDVTFEEFCDLIREDQKADLIRGVIYMASPESIEHNRLVTWLVVVVGGILEERQLGRLTVNRVAYRLAQRESPEPDVGIVLTNHVHLMKHGYVDGPPDLAIEVISPDSVHRDYELKRAQYETAGVREYWLLNPMERSALFLGLEKGKFIELPVQNHVFRCRVLQEMWLDDRWLWDLPPTRGVVERMLSAG